MVRNVQIIHLHTSSVKMSICSHPYRSIILRRHWNRSGKEALKSINELQNHLHSIQHNHVLLKSSIRSVGSTGSSNPPNPSSKETKAPSDTKNESAKVKSNQFLENYKPLSDQTDKHSTQSGRAGWQGNVYFTSREVTSASIYMCWTLFTIEGQII